MIQSSTNFEPFSASSLPRRLRDVDDSFRGFQLAPGFGEGDAGPKIKINISENEQNYQVKAEIPGLKKEDIKIDIDKNQVSITTETKRELCGNEGGTLLHSERYYGKSYRRLILASDIDEAHIIATYQDGILDLTLPKKPGGSGKQIAVI